MNKPYIVTLGVLIGIQCLFAETAKEPVASEKPASNARITSPEQLGEYRVILDRMPFGPEPRGFDPEALPGTGGGANGGGADDAMTPEQRTEEEQKLAANVRVSVLNVTPVGKVAVGFTDSSANPATHYYLLVGQSRDGWTVDEANPAEQSVTLTKDGVSVTLGLGESSGGKGGKGGKGAKPNARGGLSGGRPLPAAVGGISSLRARRQQREAEAAEQEARRKAAEEEVKREREAAAQEREAAAQEREQQKQTLLQIQEELRRQREEKEKNNAAKDNAEKGEGNADDNT